MFLTRSHFSRYESGMSNYVRFNPNSRAHLPHYIGIIQHAVEESYDYDIRNTEVYEALDWLEKNTAATWGVTLFRQGMEIDNDWNRRAEYLQNGLKTMLQQIKQPEYSKYPFSRNA